MEERGSGGHTFRSIISLFFASTSFSRASTSDGSVDAGFDASSVFVSPFAGAASEYHLDAARVLDGAMDCGRRKGEAERRVVRVRLGSVVLRHLEARRKLRWIMAGYWLSCCFG
jgi:hypothetical protein